MHYAMLHFRNSVSSIPLRSALKIRNIEPVPLPLGLSAAVASCRCSLGRTINLFSPRCAAPLHPFRLSHKEHGTLNRRKPSAERYVCWKPEGAGAGIWCCDFDVVSDASPAYASLHHLSFLSFAKKST